jgi:Holliday junction resolvase-like predicted endonuclease
MPFISKYRTLTNKDCGYAAERVACDFYIASGYDIVASNLRIRSYEIDILARKHLSLVVVEVRARHPKSIESAFSSVKRKKLSNLYKATHLIWERFCKSESFESIKLVVASVNLWTCPVTVEVSNAIIPNKYREYYS